MSDLGLGSSNPYDPDGFEIDAEVVATRVLRNDGTFPDLTIEKGAVLVPKGTRGHVRDIGLYLQRSVVYAVQLANGRLVGCLARELAPAPRPEDPETDAVLGSAGRHDMPGPVPAPTEPEEVP